jgi:hypothetical protein
MMRRVQIQLDERTYEALRRRAFARRLSISAMVREVLQEKLRSGRRMRRLTMKDFPWIGSFASKDPYVVSEEHDRALGEGPW